MEEQPQKSGTNGWVKLGLIFIVIAVVSTYAYFTYKSDTQEINSVAPSLTKAENCYKKAANIKCSDGFECTQVASFCNCMGGSLELVEDYGACVISGKEYSGISFQELEQGWYWGSSDYKKPGTPSNWVFRYGGTRSEGWFEPDFIETPDFTDSPDSIEDDYLLEKAEGSCADNTQCVWAGQGCGGGYGVCTNDPEKYRDVVTICTINEDFPTNRGYTCGCIETLSKCGWKK